jgi:hypothetical protein
LRINEERRLPSWERACLLNVIKCQQQEMTMPILLWFLGVPISLIVALWLFGVF